jgi:hypothetical protein
MENRSIQCTGSIKLRTLTVFCVCLSLHQPRTCLSTQIGSGQEDRDAGSLAGFTAEQINEMRKKSPPLSSIDSIPVPFVIALGFLTVSTMPLLAGLVFLPGDSFQEALGWGKMNGKRFGGIFSAKSTKVGDFSMASQNSAASRRASSQTSQSSAATSNH